VLDDLLEIVMWALGHDAEEYGTRVPATRYLWTAIRDDSPRLQVWYVLENEICELRWIDDAADV